jgi:transposase InsO family protein
VIEMLKSDYPISLLCDLLTVSRSSVYYRSAQTAESELREAVNQLAAQFPTYGSRRLAAQLRRAPYKLTVNRKRAQRVMREERINCRVKRRVIQTTDSKPAFPRYPNLVAELEITRPDQVWVSDITYIRVREELICLAVSMDVFTRILRGWSLGPGPGVELTLGALEMALGKGTPEIHHSDQGLQYAATDYTARLQSVGARISMAEVGQSARNGYAERVSRTIKEEEVCLNDYRDLADARKQIGRFSDDVYLSKRIHSSPGDLTPAAFEAQWRAQQKAAPTPGKKS